MKNLTSMPGLSPELKSVLLDLQFQNQLPFISGKWYFVNPYTGAVGAGGESPDEAVKSIAEAYALCRSGYGDGICVMSGGTTATNTTSLLSFPLEWTKHGITVIGIASPTGIFGRARICNTVHTTGALTVLSFLRGTASADTINRTTGSFVTDGFVAGDIIRVETTGNGADATGLVVASVSALTLTLTTTGTLVTETAVNAGSSVVSSYCASIINVSGNNNTFSNLLVLNEDTDALALGCLKVTGARNTFINCHFIGAALKTASASDRSVELGDGAQENIFIGGTIGSDTIDRGNNANCELYMNGTTSGTARNKFVNVEFLSSAEGGTAHIAIKSAAATSMGRHMIFENCTFLNYTSNLGADQASVFGGTGFNTAKIYFTGYSSMCGYALWDAATGNDCCFVTMPQGVAAGGKGIVAS